MPLSDCSSEPAEPTDAGTAPSCPTPTGSGTEHSTDVATNETWRAADGPHRILNALTVSAKLTIEPCASILVAGAISITGELSAEGTATSPITFDALDPAVAWSGLLVEADDGGMLRLAHATLRNGGNPANPNVTGMIDVRGVTGQPSLAQLRVVDVTVIGSRNYGVVVRDNASFTPDSSGLTVSGSAKFPIRIDAPIAGSLPSVSLEGNGTDEVLLDLGKKITADVTIRDRGAPYRLGGVEENAGSELVVGVSGPTPVSATLTIEAGVVARASANLIITLDKDGTSGAAVGRLKVQGTAARPVVFTSAAATPAAGDWRGIVFDAPDPANVITYARIEHAGGPSFANSFHCEANGAFSEDEDAAVALYGEPPSAFITNTSIVASAGDGIGRSWSGAPVDFLPTNTFTAIAECKQSYPRQANGSCPATTECP